MKKVLAGAVGLIVFLVLIVPTVVIRSLFGLDPVGSPKGAAKGEDVVIRVYMAKQKQIVEMNLEEYVKGVVAAEMPAQFELEALKAQAVAARTYAVKHMATFGGEGIAAHPGADVSSDYREGQACADEQELTVRWGPLGYKVYWNKISQAVDATRGIIASYQGEPILAVFHSTSGERTASAQEVWGTDYPYLKSVACNWDQQSPRYSETKEFSMSEIAERLGSDTDIVAAAQNGSTAAVQIAELTDSGRVGKIRIGSKLLSGGTVRDKLGLKSTNFKVETGADKLVFQTTGYGHGVGLCQYGANGLAKEGKDYQYILKYYYTGIDLTHISGS